MAILTLKNVNVLAPAEVRIYRVTADGTMSVDPVEFTKLLNGNGRGAGIKLLAAYEVSCVGAVPFAGNFELTLDDGEFYVTYAPGIKAKAASVDEFIQILTGDAIGLEVSDITPWTHQVS